MANTYTLIASNTVGSGGSSTVTFSAIPQTYTDLVVKISGRTNRTADVDSITMTFNGSSTGITWRTLMGDGTSATSGTAQRFWVDSDAYTASTFGNAEVYIPNYTSANYKSTSIDTVAENNATAAYVELLTQLWSNTAAITSIELSPQFGSSWKQYSTFYLYGVTKLANTGTGSKAIGGTVTTSGSYTIHTFTSTGMFTPTTNVNVDYLVVAGGGGGGAQTGGGGGGGGLLTSTAYSTTSGTNYAVIVGAGGAGGPYTGGAAYRGSNGGNSSFATITATGGGGGGAFTVGLINGLSGGSGGGATNRGSAGTGGAGTSGQGNAGGDAADNGNYAGGGGGGAGGVGSNKSTSQAEQGGNGGAASTNSYQTGSNQSYSGGGGGATGFASGLVQATGGTNAGNGGVGNTTAPTAGTANFGGGGGGNRDYAVPAGTSYGMNGGSGIVIVRYLT